MEEWRDVPGFVGYQISAKGRVRSRKRRRWGGLEAKWHIIKGSIGTTRRYKVCLFRDAKGFWRDVHRLMLEAFIGPCPEGLQGLHRDDDPLNNSLDNLYWGTPKQNAKDRKQNGKQADKRGSKHHMAKLTEKDVRTIRRRLARGETQAAIAQDYGVKREAISSIHRRRTWQHI